MKNEVILVVSIIFIVIILVVICLIINNNKFLNITNNLVSDESVNFSNIENENNIEAEKIDDIANEEDSISEGESEMLKLNVIIGGQNFSATLYDNETTRTLINQLPLTLNMSELNGNEKYYYFDSSFPTASERVGSIKSGELMLYGSDCLVLFYDNFSTPYSYTRIGYIDNTSELANSVGHGNVNVTFELANN